MKIYFCRSRICCRIVLFCLFLLAMTTNISAEDKEGSVYPDAEVIWSEFDGEDYEIYYADLRNDVWGSKTQITDNKVGDLYPSISSGTSGITWVVWSAVKGGNTYLFYSNFDGSSWLRPKQIETSFSSNTTPSIIVDNKNVPWVVWTGFDGQDDDIYFTRWNGYDWDEPRRVNSDDVMPDVFPIIGINEEGNPWVKWSGYDNGKYRDFYSEWIETRWDDEREDMTNSLYNSLIQKVLQSIPRLPDFIDEVDQASICIKGERQSQTIPLRDIEKMSMMRKSSGIVLNNIDPYLSQDSNQTIIVGFGDSITKGTPYVEGDEGAGRRVGGYEPELEELHNAFIGPSAVYNWGVGGENTISGMYRIDDVIEAYDYVDHILILEGVNDLSLFSCKTTIHNLDVMIERSRSRDVNPILATLTPAPKKAGGLGENIPTEYNPRIKELAIQRGVVLSDQYSPLIDNWESLSDDGIHPNRAGYSIMAQTWFNALSKPLVTTLNANAIRETSVLLNGLVNPHGHITKYFFEYGTTNNYGTPTAIMDAGSGTSEIAVSVELGELTGETTYHYRLVATNAYGKSYGRDITFTTSDGVATTLEASSIGSTIATLNGIVNPKGREASYYFEYGITKDYGNETQSINAGSGTSEIDVSTNLTGLTSQTTYHFRLVVTYNSDISYGEDLTFTTNEKRSSSSRSGCFVATAAFGSSIEKHVMILKEFRDKYLTTSEWGRKFVEYYYEVSPSIADIISHHDFLRITSRICLYPFIGFCFVMLNTSLAMKMLILVLMIPLTLYLAVSFTRIRSKTTM